MSRAQEIGPPKFDETDVAGDVLADPFFYDDDEKRADSCERYRSIALQRGATIRDVFNEYVSPRGKNGGGNAGMHKLASDLGASFRRVERYFFNKDIPLERLLTRLEVLPLDGSLNPEVQWFFKYRVEGGVPTTIGTFQATARATPRSLRLCYVLGSSGSGKTFFSLEHLRTFLNVDQHGNCDLLPSMTIYLKSYAIEGMGAGEWEEDEAPEMVVSYVKKSLGEYIKAYLKREWDMSTPIAMHVCLVIDEASAALGFFDCANKVTKLHDNLMSAKLAQSCALVVCGTGLKANTFSSDLDAYYFRMRPWTRADLECIVDHHVVCYANSKLRWEETADFVEAICSVPLLVALGANARCAHFMVEGGAEAAQHAYEVRWPGWWQKNLRGRLPALVSSVILKYIGSNKIGVLVDGQRRRIAAWVLGALSQLERGALTIPDYPGLTPFEANAANLLLQLNVQKLGHGTPDLVDGEVFSASLTPAMAIVLFHMAGVFADLVPGWRGAVEIAALCAANRAISERWSKHERVVREMQRGFVPGRDGMDNHEFSKALQGLDRSKQTEHEKARQDLEAEFLYALTEVTIHRPQKQLLSSKAAAVHIPIVSKHAILVNGDHDTFVDVVAPYTFVQSRPTSSSQENWVDVNLQVELAECCLLKKANRAASGRVVRGLLALWDGTLSDRMAASMKTGAKPNKKEKLRADAASDSSPSQGSRAFPANLIKFSGVTDGVTYAEIVPGGGQVRGTTIVLPKRPGILHITFVLVTNADEVRLTLFKDKKLLTITEDSLTGDMEVDPTKLADEDERESWSAFQDAVVPGVKVQFLFTRNHV